MKSLKDVFDIKDEDMIYKDIADYDVFKDKDLLDELRLKIIQRLIDNTMDASISLMDFTKAQVDSVIEGYNLTDLEKNYLYNLTRNEISGYGPITDLLMDTDITEIMVNGPDEVYIELSGKLIKDDSISFINDEHIMRTLERLIAPLGQAIDKNKALLDVRLRDGSRLNAVIPPLSPKGPIFTIRRFNRKLDTIEDLLRNGTLTPYMARFLEACVQAKLNILVVGGSGSGKTTLLNVLSSFINDDERIITIEDGRELKLKQKHVVALETRFSDAGVTSELITNALNMRPDRIILGQMHASCAFTMIESMHNGKTGSLTTMYAVNTNDAINRLENVLEMDNRHLSLSVIREYLTSALSIIVETTKLNDGKIRVTKISEVTGYNSRGITLKEIFAFNITGFTEDGDVIGEFVLNDYKPKIYEYIKEQGIDTLNDIFE